MQPELTFTEGSKDAIERLLKRSRDFYVMIDGNTDNVAGILKSKTLLEKLPEAIQQETDCEEVVSIELEFIKHSYSIQCDCVLLIDGEEEDRVFHLNCASVY